MDKFISIKEAKDAKKGSFTGVCIQISELGAGTAKNGNDWKKKSVQLENGEDNVWLTAWNEQTPKIDQFELGVVYGIEQPMWDKQEYNGELGCSFGKYCKVTKITTTTKPNPAMSPTVSSLETLPEPDELITYTIAEESLLLLQIEREVKKTVALYETNPNGQKIGMQVKEIYRKITKSNFTKASDITK